MEEQVIPRARTRDNAAAHLRLLVDTGLRLAGDRRLDSVAQTGVHAGLHLAGAHHAIFIYDDLAEDGDSTQHFQLAGPSPNPFALPPTTALLSKHDLGAPLKRIDDLRDELAATPPLPFDFAAIRSFLALPICTHAGEPLGRLLFSHPDPGVFNATSEPLLHTLAQQIAFAIENVRLASSLSHEIALSDHSRRLQRETADRLAQALEAAKLGTWTWDRATDMLDLDERAAHLFFTQPHVPIARSDLRRRIVMPADAPATSSNLERSLETGDRYSVEYRVVDPSPAAGREPATVWIASAGIPTCTPGSGKPTGMVGTVQDITARTTQESVLRQSEKLAATGRLAATIAHEINNPLEAVTNLIYLAKTDPGIPPHLQKLLETADGELGRVAQIAQQTLGFYRDTSRPVEIDLNQLLSAVADLFARKMAFKKVTCSLDLQNGLRLHGLQGEIRQVFSNLFVNAIDACGESPTACNIHIRARVSKHHERGQGIAVCICDQGHGIPHPARERLFTPFFTTKQSVGTGLGLWVTRGIIEKQGGHIHYRSRTENPTGTVFRVFLPAINSPALNTFVPTTQVIQ